MGTQTGVAANPVAVSHVPCADGAQHFPSMTVPSDVPVNLDCDPELEYSAFVTSVVTSPMALALAPRVVSPNVCKCSMASSLRSCSDGSSYPKTARTVCSHADDDDIPFMPTPCDIILCTR